MPLALSAHSGRTDASGCHTNRKTGDYHCHVSKSETKSVKLNSRTEARGNVSKISNDKNCDDFASQVEAQKFFESQGGPQSDPNGLDRDHDGIACEALK